MAENCIDDFGYLHGLLDDYRQTPESYTLELNMSLSSLIIQRLESLGWTQRRLARESGKKDSFISRILHGEDYGCTLATAGELLCALGIRGRITPCYDFDTGSGFFNIIKDECDAEENEQAEKWTEETSSGITGSPPSWTYNPEDRGITPREFRGTTTSMVR